MGKNIFQVAVGFDGPGYTPGACGLRTFPDAGAQVLGCRVEGCSQCSCCLPISWEGAPGGLRCPLRHLVPDLGGDR